MTVSRHKNSRRRKTARSLTQIAAEGDIVRTRGNAGWALSGPAIDERRGQLTAGSFAGCVFSSRDPGAHTTVVWKMKQAALKSHEPGTNEGGCRAQSQTAANGNKTAHTLWARFLSKRKAR